MTTLLSRIFSERRQTGSMDLEAVEMGFRTALHQAGAAALSHLLQFPEPARDQREIPCRCGHQACYRELRSRALLTVLGEVRLVRPGICVHTATRASSLSIGNSILRIVTALLACAACKLWLASKHPSITAASRSSFWPVWK